MIRILLRLLPALSALLLTAPAPLRADDQAALELGFRADREALLAEAASSGRMVLAFFTTDWCSWCRRLEQDVFRSEDFQQGSAEWLKLVVDAEKGSGPDYAASFRVAGFPTIVLLNPDGSEIDRLPGYMPMPGFLEVFQDYARGIGTLDALQEELAARPQDAELKLGIARKLDARGRVEETEALLQQIIDADPANAGGWTDDAAAALAIGRFQRTGDEALLEDLLMRWPGLEDGPQVYNALIGMASRRDDIPRVKTLLDRALADYPEDADLHNAYAWTAAELEWNLPHALEVALKAARLSGDAPGVLDTVAEVQFRLGDRQAALATIARALEQQPDDEYLLRQQAKFRAAP
jgi:thioredoxin-related protein